jgi:hypothetical protein
MTLEVRRRDNEVTITACPFCGADVDKQFAYHTRECEVIS